MRQWMRTLAVLLAASWLIPASVAAQNLEGVLMPGKVIAGHAKLENDCGKCHVKFDRAAQDRLCLDCHKPVATDVARHQGYHGRINVESCRTCHTDHKGREMQIALVDEKAFDHAKTDFALSGAHARAKCESCHVAGKKFREAPWACNDCHRKDDVHKGGLGTDCAACHSDSAWKPSRFDHARTRFALTGKHVDAACKSCHIDERFKPTPLTCVGCHRQDDKQHRGRLGEKCETCHGASNWRDVTAFSHDRDAHFALRGKHRTAKCESCHTASSGLIKLPTTCNECHMADDKHNGTLGSVCGDCHTEQNWREAKYNHDSSRFKLAGKHRDIECKECHKDPASFKGAPLECIACHRKDDTHKGRYDAQCGTCHTAARWRDILFRHDRDTKYRLTGRHATTKCDDCHAGNVYRDKLSTVCYACHEKDDKHRDQLGRQCDQCHTTRDWKQEVRFDHAKSRFPLLGAHLKTECKACHVTPAFKDAKRECVACHSKDDKHKARLGAQCGECHNARSWKLWDFDHAKRTQYPLDGAHAKVGCVDCHKLAGGDKILVLPTNCVACHQADDVHGGNFGGRCERCHDPRSFRDVTIRRFGATDAKPSGSSVVVPGPETRQ
jgi:hypothetical protein